MILLEYQEEKVQDLEVVKEVVGQDRGPDLRPQPDLEPMKTLKGWWLPQEPEATLFPLTSSTLVIPCLRRPLQIQH